MSQKSEPGDLALLTDTNAGIIKRSLALNRLATDRRPEVEHIAAGFLTHSESLAREEAVKALIMYLAIDAYVDDVLRMVSHDPAWEVRMEAATSLAFYTRETGKRTAEIVRAFANVVLHDPSEDVVAAAYFGIDFSVIRGAEPPHFTEIPREQYDMALVRSWRARGERRAARRRRFE